MANTPSAKKDARKSALRAQRNRSIKSAVKTKVNKFRRGVVEGADGIGELGLTAISALDRAVSKGVLHRNNAARRKSRLMKRLSAAGPTPAAEPAVTARASRSAGAAKAPSRSRAKR